MPVRQISADACCMRIRNYTSALLAAAGLAVAGAPRLGTNGTDGFLPAAGQSEWMPQCRGGSLAIRSRHRLGSSRAEPASW